MTSTEELRAKVMQDAFEKATRGWRQCDDILRDATKALDFAIDQIADSQPAFEPDANKARQFAEALIALRTAKRYCAAQWPEREA